MKIKEIILDFIKDESYKPLNKGQLAKIFNISKKEMKDFSKLLNEMEKEGLIIQDNKQRYVNPEDTNMIIGKLQSNPKGFGFVIPEKKDMKDIFISRDNINGAINGDKVIVELFSEGSENKKAEGKITQILERANSVVVGVFQNSKTYGFVVPDNNRINTDIFIPKEKINDAKDGQKVVAKITVWPQNGKNAEGEVIEVLGFIDEPGIDIISIIRKHNLPEEFPKKVLDEAESIPVEIPEESLKNRLDLRNEVIFTIDGADAKDLDDAVSIKMLENGNYKLGVHIADVTHYVKENQPLDKEALKRGTSVYLVDRVIPMLPKKLSNGVCSLNPHVPRLTLSVFMEIDNNGKVLNHEVAETVIESKERLVYTDISNILENDDAELKEKYKDLLPHFNNMEKLANILKKKRERRGAIDFDFDEAKIILDENGKPIEIKKAERRIANRMIEEFMLICNETVAEYMYWSEIPFLYRIHEDPSEEKINEFSKFIYNFGYTLKGSSEIHPKELQALLKKVEGTKEETVINTLMLRSLKKAKYDAEITGHFGLAAKYYSHFTSPIRRYPDLQIHRIIKHFINNKLNDKMIQRLKKILPDVAEQSSSRERVAVEAERETNDYKMTEFMSERIGEIYEGIISSVTSFGMFVELDNTIEGLIRVERLNDDYYIYDEVNYRLVGERTKKVYKIGDIATIKVINTNLEKREIDFELYDNNEENVEENE